MKLFQFCGVPALLAIVLAACADPAPSETVETREGPPNIVVIFADDLGYGDVGVFGGTRARTPHLDRMAAEGLRLTSFYSFPTCSPSRAALLTGCYPPRVGIPKVLGPPSAEWTKKRQYGLHPDEELLPELLKDAGYATGMVGKWHLGHFPETRPLEQGFDEWLGIPYSNDMIPKQGYPDLALFQDRDTLELNPDQTDLTKRFADRSVRFVREHAGEPFFLYVAPSMPHVPLFTTEESAGRSGTGIFGDVIEEVDDLVGAILAELEAQGIDDNTLVLFTSDNGPWLSYGNHAGSAGPFRAGKGTTYEGGMRVPFIARWPGGIPAATSSHAPMMLIDVLPTLADITSVDLPERKIDGRSLAPLFTSTIAPATAPLYYFREGKLGAVREGKWKLMIPHGTRKVRTVGNDGERGEYDYFDTETELYNVVEDPAERYNVLADHPEVAARLAALIEAKSVEIEAEKREPFRPAAQ